MTPALISTGATDVPGAEGAGQFLRQRFMVQGWGRASDPSFDGPSWSLSVEVLCYLVFFAVCRVNFRRGWHLALLVALGLAVVLAGASLVGRGLFSFCCGGLVFYVYAWVVGRRWRVPAGASALLAVDGTAGALALLANPAPVLFVGYKMIFADSLVTHGKD